MIHKNPIANIIWLLNGTFIFSCPHLFVSNGNGWDSPNRAFNCKYIYTRNISLSYPRITRKKKKHFKIKLLSLNIKIISVYNIYFHILILTLQFNIDYSHTSNLQLIVYHKTIFMKVTINHYLVWKISHSKFSIAY